MDGIRTCCHQTICVRHGKESLFKFQGFYIPTLHGKSVTFGTSHDAKRLELPHINRGTFGKMGEGQSTLFCPQAHQIDLPHSRAAQPQGQNLTQRCDPSRSIMKTISPKYSIGRSKFCHTAKSKNELKENPCKPRQEHKNRNKLRTQGGPSSNMTKIQQ